MRSFRDFLKEEVLPSVQVADGSLDISKPAVRAAINAAIAGVVSQPAVTPYVVFNRLSKLLAQYHIILPKRFLEGDKGVEVFELKQFGHRMGMTDSGEFVHEVPTTHYLFVQYGIITPMGVTYAKPLVGGMFRVTARLVDKAELDRLLDMAEITMSEEAEVRQLAAKAMAPKEEPHTALGDCGCNQGKSPSTKKAIKVSMRRIDEEMSHDARELASYADNHAQLYRSSHQPIIKNLERKHKKGTYDHGKAEKLWGYHAKRAADAYHKEHGHKFSVAHRKEAAKHMADSARDEHGFGSVKEESDPCWKGYEMIGMKKKGSRKVPNCVPVKEEDINEVSKETLASYIPKAAHSASLMASKRAAKGFQHHGTPEYEKSLSKQMMRHRGITRAAEKLAKEETISELDRSMFGILGRYTQKTKDDPKRKEGRNLALKKRWGDKKYGLPEPKVKAVERPMKEEQIDELSKETLKSYRKKVEDEQLHKNDAKSYKHTRGHTAAGRKLGMSALDSTLDTIQKRFTPKSMKNLADKEKEARENDPGFKAFKARKRVEEEKGDRLTPQTMNNPTGRDKTGASERDRGITFVPKNTRGNDGDMPQNTLKPEGKFSNRVDPEGRRNEYAPGGTMFEKAPPGAKFERMVKHIKKGYSKDGLTAKEKSIAYATAWKAKNREENK